MMRGQAEQTKKKDMSTKINEIVQQKARESAGTLKRRNPLSPSLQIIDRGFAFRGSDEAKRNIMWVNTTYQNQNYFNDSGSSVQNKAKNLSRIKAAQARLVQNSAQNGYSSKQDLSSNNLKDQDTWSFFRSQSRNSSQNRLEHRCQPGQLCQPQKTSKPHQIHSAMKLGEGQYNKMNGYGNYDNHSNGRNSRRNNDNETSWDESNEESRQTQLREQVLIQEGRILQLEELLKRETLNSEEQRSQVRYLKTELLKSVSASGLAELFEEAYISSLDKQVDIIVQLKAIQQKIEEDFQDSQSVMHSQDENVQQLMEQNEIMQMQANQYFQLHEEVSTQFQIVVEEKRVIEEEKYQLEEANLKLIEEIENAVQKNQRLAEENQRFAIENERINRENIMKNRFLEEREKSIQELELLLKDTNEEKIEQERVIEDNQSTIIRLEEQYELVIKECEIQIISKNQEIADLNEKISNQKEEILTLNKEITKQTEQNNLHKGQVEGLRNELEKQTIQIENQQQRIQQLEKENTGFKAQEKIKEKSQEKEKSVATQGFREEDQVSKSEFESIQSRLNEEIKKYEEASKQNKNIEEEMKVYTKEINKLKDQNKHYLDTNTQLQQLVEQNQLLLSQANQELIQKEKVEGSNRVIQQNHELKAQINNLRQQDTATINELKHRIEFMQQKSHFFSNQVIDMAKKLSILDNQDDAVSQEEYESLVLEISSKIDSLIEEKQSENENINQEQIEEELVTLQLRLAEMVQEKYILETEVEQLRGFIQNNQVFEVLDKYSECLCQLFDNESQQKQVNDALVECSEMNEEHEQQAEQEKYIERLKQERAESFQQHERLIAQRDYYHSQIEKLQEEEMEKYKMNEYDEDIHQASISNHSQQGEQNDEINQKFDALNGKYAIHEDIYGNSHDTEGEQEGQEDGSNADEFEFHQEVDFEDQDEQNQYDQSKYSQERGVIEKKNKDR